MSHNRKETAYRGVCCASGARHIFAEVGGVLVWEWLAPDVRCGGAPMIARFARIANSRSPRSARTVRRIISIFWGRGRFYTCPESNHKGFPSHCEMIRSDLIGKARPHGGVASPFSPSHVREGLRGTAPARRKKASTWCWPSRGKTSVCRPCLDGAPKQSGCAHIRSHTSLYAWVLLLRDTL